jgi:hypothetical protein
MKKYICCGCADKLNLKTSARTSDPLQSQYQVDKWYKHTIPSTSIGYQTLFDSRSSDYYAGVIYDAVDLGFVEDDDQSRLNILYCPSTGSRIGRAFARGQDLGPQDMVRVVKWSEEAGIHAMLDGSSDFSAARCSRCGGPVL